MTADINGGVPLVSIVIVNYNARRFLDELLISVSRQEYPLVEVLFVDNGSSDDSVEFVRRMFPEITVIENDDNLGYGVANNIGIRSARGDYVFLLNTDTIIKPDAISNLVDFMANRPKVGAAQSKLLLGFDGTLIDSAGSYMTWSGFLHHHGWSDVDGPEYENDFDIFSGKGASLMLRRSVIDDVGVFDDDFFLYFEESDLCWRIWLAGYSISFVPASVVYHEGGGLTRTLPSSFVDYESFKNRICSLAKNLGKLKLIQILPLHLMLCLCTAAANAAQGRHDNGAAIVRAIWWNAQHIRETLRKRNDIQRRRRVTDRELWPRVAREQSLGDAYGWLQSYLRAARQRG